MRISYCTFQDIEQFYGTNDFQIEARYDKFNNKEYIMLRFGYWAEVDLIGLEEIIILNFFTLYLIQNKHI